MRALSGDLPVVLVAEASPDDPDAIGGVSGLLRALRAHAPSGWVLLTPRPCTGWAGGAAPDLGPSLCSSSLPHRILFPLRLLTRLRKMTSLQPSVIYTHSNEAAMLLCLLRRLGLVRSALVHHQHGSESPLTYATFRIGRAPGLVWLYDLLLRTTHRSVDHLVVIDRACLEANLAWGVPRSRMTVLSNAVDTDVFHPSEEEALAFRDAYGIPSGSRIVAFVGRLEEVKRIDLLIEAVPLASCCPFLVIAGEGTRAESLRRLASASASSSRVIFTGALDSRALPGLYSAADVLALPSAAEGVPMVILEALSCGVPVVATRVGGIPDLIDESSGILLDRECTASELAGALSDALGRQWDAAGIRMAAERRSAQRAVEVLQEVFKGIASVRGSQTSSAPL